MNEAVGHDGYRCAPWLLATLVLLVCAAAALTGCRAHAPGWTELEPMRQYAVHDEDDASEDDEFSHLSSDPVDVASQVSELRQAGRLNGGCEIVALASVLQAAGIDVQPEDIADNYLEIASGDSSGDFVEHYVGSPYERGGGFAPVVCKAANSCMEERGSPFRMLDATGASFDVLIEQVRLGRPVLVWTTMGMEQPQWSGVYVLGYQWYANEHCVVFCSGPEDGTVGIMDPLAGMVERDRDAFRALYEDCGSMCLVLVGSDAAR